MTMTYRTVVVHLPPTPLGLLPERWRIEHWCSRCRRRVPPAQLITHAQGHDRADHDGGDESFQSRQTSGTMASGRPDPTEARVPEPGRLDDDHRPT